VITAAEHVTGRRVPVEESPRRPGDPPQLVADASKARAATGWQARWTSIDDIVRSASSWHESHPTKRSRIPRRGCR
jgi:UDP-glucose 4-epimerase